MILTEEQIAIIADKPEELETDKVSTTSTSDNLADVFTRKRAKIMWPTDEEVLQFDKEWGDMTLFPDPQKIKPAKYVSQEAKEPIDDQSDEVEHNMLVSYVEYKEKLDKEENMEYDDYPNDLDSCEYEYVFDCELDNEPINKTSKSDLISNELKAKDIDEDDKDKEDMIELKD